MNALKPWLAGKTHVIWDWNGTLLNDLALVVETISDILEQEGKGRISRDEYLAKFCFPVREYYSRLGFDFRRTSFESLADRFIQRFHEGVILCPLQNGAKDFLSELHGAGITQSVLSAAQESSLKQQIEHHQISQYFQFVFGLPDHHAAGKLARGRQLIAESKHPREKTILIGDTDHDLEVGIELGIEVVLVADGHQSYERLKPLHSAVIESRI